jgi:predicted transcriptional regulator
MDDANVAQVPVIEADEIVGILPREQAQSHIRLRTTLGV